MVANAERLEAASRLHDRIVRAIVRKRSADYELALLLRTCFDDRLYCELGYTSIVQYGERAHGLGRAKTRALVRLARTMAEVPALSHAVQTGALPWTKAREVARIATIANADEWLRHAGTVTNRELENLVRHAHRGESVSDAEERRADSDDLRTFAVRNLSADQLDLVERALELVRQASGIDREDFSRADALATIAQRVLVELSADASSATPSGVRYQRVIHVCASCRQVEGETGRPDDTDVSLSECDAEVVSLLPAEPSDGATGGPTGGAPERDAPDPCTRVHPRGASRTHGEPATAPQENGAGSTPPAKRGARRRTVPPSVRAAVLHRDRHTCRIPDCTNRLYLDVHHVVPQSAGGPHTESNLVCLCASHHRLLHDGRLAIMHAGRGRLRVQFPDGRTALIHLDSS